MDIKIDQVKKLRDLTGISISECKKALVEANGNQEEALKILEKRGLDKAALKAEREVREGVVGYYIHQNNKVGALVEVNCETDFVARTDDFKELAHNLAVHLAAYNPLYLDAESIPETVRKEQDDIDTYVSENTFLFQPFIKDTSKTVQDVISSYIAKFGENIKIGKFYRISIGN